MTILKHTENIKVPVPAIFVWLACLVFATHGFSQTKINQIYQELVAADELTALNKDSAFIIAHNKINELKRNKNLSDTLLGYAYYIAGESKRFGAEYMEARTYHDSALLYYSHPPYAIGLGRVWHGKGNVSLLMGNLDSALFYYKEAIKIRSQVNNLMDLSKSIVNVGIVYFKRSEYDSALFYYTESLRLRNQINDSTGIITSLTNIGNIYLYQNNFNEAEAYYSKAKSMIDTTKASRQLASLLNNIGNIYFRQSRYSLALENFMQAIRWYDVFGDRASKARIYNNAALIHFEMGNLDQAMDYHNRALELSLEINDRFGIADSYYYLGRIYHINKDYIDAKKNFVYSLAQKRELGDVSGSADVMQNLGVVYLDEYAYDSAFYYFNQSLKLYKSVVNKFGQATCLNNMAELYLKTTKLNKAYLSAAQSLEIAKTYQGLSEMRVSYNLQSRVKELMGDYQAALKLTKEEMKINDSILNEKTAQTILELESKYQLERKEQAIRVQQLQLSQRDLEFKNQEIEMAWQKRIRNLSLILVVFLTVLIFWLIRSLVYRKALNNKLAKQRHDILIKNEELAQLNEELQTQQHQIILQNEVLVKQNLTIEEANATFHESVKYAEYIQQAVLPSKLRLSAIIPNHFVLYLPKDIVGGDFYWVHQMQSKLFIAVGDCTGHGVPGGFLSMLGLAFLKEIVTIQQIYQSNTILEQLRNQIIDSLQQTNDLLEYVDGIDMSLLIIDKEASTIDYAGARGKLLIANNRNVELLKGDRISVGFSPKMKSFINEVRPLEPNQVFYLFTDGSIDQYNNKDEKFGMLRFMELCRLNHDKSLTTQKELFFQTFIQWKGSFEQIDDATVLAFKV